VAAWCLDTCAGTILNAAPMGPVRAGYPARMGIHGSQGLSVDAVLHELRQRADEDFLDPSAAERESGRHQVDLPELELRVSLTRSRYPNTPEGEDCYAVTVSRIAMDHEPEEGQARRVLYALFGDSSLDVEERRAGGPVVRMYRIPLAALAPLDQMPPVDNPGVADPRVTPET
jgi:hypothetical protein